MRRVAFSVLAVVGLSFPLALAAVPLVLASGNASNDKLLQMNETEQAAMLSKATNYQCLGKKPYYMGTEGKGANTGVSFWSITCDNGGKKFLIVIAPDASGSTRIFDCDHLQMRFPKENWECYSRLPDQRSSSWFSWFR